MDNNKKPIKRGLVKILTFNDFEFKPNPWLLPTLFSHYFIHSFIHLNIYIEHQQGVGILLDTEDTDANMVACPNLGGGGVNLTSHQANNQL